MFFQSVVSEILYMYFISCLHVWERVGEIRIGLPSGMFVLYRDIANLHNHIRNIDQLEMKLALVSGGSIL